MISQNDIHRSHVPTSKMSGKNQDTEWFFMSLSVVVQGCDRNSFPCSGNGRGASWNNRGSNGYYWSASLHSATNGRNLNFNSGGVNPQNNNNRFNGFAVRPVQHTLLHIILFYNILYGFEPSAVIARPLSSVLRCEETQVEAFLCPQMGEELQGEHGRALQRFVLQTLQASALEMLHHRLSEEKGDICCCIPRQNRASSILQLYAPAVRADIHTGFLLLYQGTRHGLRHQAHNGLLPERKPELAAQMLRYAPRHSRLLHAHQPEASVGDSHRNVEKDWQSPRQQSIRKDVERCSGLGLYHMAHGGYRHARPERELHLDRRPLELGRPRPCQVDALIRGRPRTSNRQSHLAVVLECLFEHLRPIHEARSALPFLRQICR